MSLIIKKLAYILRKFKWLLISIFFFLNISCKEDNILTNNNLKIVFATQPVSGTTQAFKYRPTIHILDHQDSIIKTSSDFVTMSLGNNPGNAILEGETTVSTIEGEAVFSKIWITERGLGYTLIASVGATTVESEPIDIYDPEEVIFILFVSQTSYGTGGFGLGIIRLQLLNGQGGVIRSATDEVTMSIGNNPGNANLEGSTTLSAINGEVRFEDLIITEPGIGYTLIATSGIGSGESRPIDLRPQSCPDPPGGSIISNPIDFANRKSHRESSHLNWTQQISGTNQTLYDVWGSSPNDVFAVGNEGTIVHYDGTNWSHQNSGTDNLLFSVWGSGSSDVFAGGTRGTILHYDGTSWSLQDSDGLDQNVVDLWGSSPNNFFAASFGTSDHRISHYDGNAWEQQSIFYCGVLVISGSSSDNVFNGGVDGLIMKYDGINWIRQSVVNTGADIKGLFIESNTNAFAVAESGLIFQYDGMDWNRKESGISTTLLDVDGSSSSDAYAVGMAGTILYYDGMSWATELITSNQELLNGIFVATSTEVFVVGENGFVLFGNE